MAKNKKKSRTGHSRPPLTQEDEKKITDHLPDCIKKNRLKEARLMLRGLGKEDKKRIVSYKVHGYPPLLLAALYGKTHFVNYLLNDCKAEIEQQGIYDIGKNLTRHHRVTPLWCAAAANKLEVVKILLDHSANVNATCDLGWTPVQSACDMNNIEVVTYLVEKGADIHKPNINGVTCLMSAIQSVDLCRFLMKKNCSIDEQDSLGNSALHYAICEGLLETVRSLLRRGADPYVKNNDGDDAIQTAALRGKTDILDFLLSRVKPPVERQIEACELIATYIVDQEQDIKEAIENWRFALKLRYKDPENVIEKRQAPPNPAYQNHLEARSMAELEEIAINPDAVYMQALIIRERILGPHRMETVSGLMYRGEIYSNMDQFQRCVDLWKYAFHLRHSQHCRGSISSDVVATQVLGVGNPGSQPLNYDCLTIVKKLCQLFCSMINQKRSKSEIFEVLQLKDFHEVFDMTICELKHMKQHLNDMPKQPLATDDWDSQEQQQLQRQQEEFQTIVLLVLHLVNLLHFLLQSCAARTYQFRKTVRWFVELGLRNPQGRGLLHLAVEKTTQTIENRFYTPFPATHVVKVLLHCGADPNETDADDNTPLHLVVAGAINSGLSKEGRERRQVIIKGLLDAGSHVDAINKEGVTATHGLANWWPKFRPSKYLSLQCLAARVIRRHNIRYEGIIPDKLKYFVEKHSVTGVF